MTVTIIGIDPGITGAIAILRDEALEVLDIPTVRRNEKTNQVDPRGLAAVFRAVLSAHGPVHTIIEQVHSMPGQGVSSMFSMGMTCGIIEGVVSAMGIPYELVTPQIWKRSLGVGKEKDLARAMASRLYPQADLSLKKHHNRAEAILIARYAREKYAKAS
jgi:crossover junction endodeoxyribonuclease RuvC